MVIVAAFVTNSSGWLPGSNGEIAIVRQSYERPPKLLLADDEFRFTRLNGAQLSKVRVTPTEAILVAISMYGRDPRSRVTFVSLGGYVDASQIVPDWVGTTSWVPKALPAYIVRISGLQIVLDGPHGDVAKNRSENVIVNAIDGRIVSTMTYD